MRHCPARLLDLATVPLLERDPFASAGEKVEQELSGVAGLLVWMREDARLRR